MLTHPQHRRRCHLYRRRRRRRRFLHFSGYQMCIDRNALVSRSVTFQDEALRALEGRGYISLHWMAKKLFRRTPCTVSDTASKHGVNVAAISGCRRGSLVEVDASGAEGPRSIESRQ